MEVYCVILAQKCFTFAPATKVSVLSYRDVIVERCNDVIVEKIVRIHEYYTTQHIRMFIYKHAASHVTSYQATSIALAAEL